MSLEGAFIKNKIERNYALDLLRIICMFMIIFLHMGSHGGILETTKADMGCYSIELLVQALCIVSVDVFVLISAWFLVDQKFRFSKLIHTVIEVWFYSWIIFAIFKICGLNVVSTRQSIFPISFAQNWFATAYVGLYLVFPILNKVIDNTSKKSHGIITLLLFVMLGLWSDIIPSANPFGANPGACTVWFIELYFIAAYLKKYVSITDIYKPFAIYFVASLVTVTIQILLERFCQVIPAISTLATDRYYYRYNSLFVVIASISFFILFTNVNISRGGIGKNNKICKSTYIWNLPHS